MHHVLIHKYDFAGGGVESQWTTLCALLPETEEVTPPPFYLQLKRECLDVVVQFLRKYDQLPLQYRFCYLIDDELLLTEPRVWLHALILPLENPLRLMGKTGFPALSHRERLAVFELAIRGAVNVAIEDLSIRVTLSTVDDGFSWYVARLDCGQLQ